MSSLAACGGATAQLEGSQREAEGGDACGEGGRHPNARHPLLAAESGGGEAGGEAARPAGEVEQSPGAPAARQGGGAEQAAAELHCGEGEAGGAPPRVRRGEVRVRAAQLVQLDGGEARLMRGRRCGCVRELDGSRGERAAPTSASTPPPAASPAWLTRGLRRGGAAGVEAEVAEVAAAVQPG